LKDFGFFLEDFLKIIFLYGEIFEFSSFFSCPKIPFNVNGKATVWHTPCLCVVEAGRQTQPNKLLAPQVNPT